MTWSSPCPSVQRGSRSSCSSREALAQPFQPPGPLPAATGPPVLPGDAPLPGLASSARTFCVAASGSFSRGSAGRRHRTPSAAAWVRAPGQVQPGVPPQGLGSPAACELPVPPSVVTAAKAPGAWRFVPPGGRAVRALGLWRPRPRARGESAHAPWAPWKAPPGRFRVRAARKPSPTCARTAGIVRKALDVALEKCQR